MDKGRLRAAYMHLPLAFEPNRGQSSPNVDYLAHGPGYTVGLTREGAILALENSTKRAKSRRAALGLRLVGANAHPQVTGVDRQQGKVNYYPGNDQKNWRTGIATFGKVTYSAVYPGINLTYYGNQRNLEYDFVVAPGADPSPIKLRLYGARKLRLDAGGNLILTTRGGTVTQQRPFAYQLVNGTRHKVASRFVLEGRQLGLALGRYDTTKALVIDPTLAYSTFFGGDGEDPSYGMAVDPAGNVHITGVTNSMSSPPGANNFPIVNPWGPEGAVCCGGNDTGRVFVTKMNPTGTALVFSTYLGGFAGYGGVHRACPSPAGCGGAPGFARGWDTGHSIAADATGNVYVTGWAESLDFPTTADAVRKSHPGPNGCTDPTCYAHDYGDHPRDAFIAKFTPTGALTYSSLIGGRGSDGGMGIDVVDTGPGAGIYIVGLAQSPDFFANDSLSPPGGSQHYPAVAAFQSALNVNSKWVTNPNPPPSCKGATPSVDWSCWRDGFAMRLSLDAKTVVWSTLIGGTADDGAYGIAVNRTTGDAVVAGETESTDFPAGAGTLPPQQPCLGGDGGYHAEPSVAKASDAPFACHMTPTPAVGEPDSTNKPNVDAFVAKFSAAGAPVFMTYLGGSMDDDAGATLDDLAGDFGDSAAMDDAGNIYVTGWTESTSTPIAMCGPPGPPTDMGSQPCPHKVPFPTTAGAYMEGMPQDPIASCGAGAPPDCVAPNRRLHAVAFVIKMDPNGHWGPTSPGVNPAGPATAGTYSTYLGGYGDDAAFSVAVDSAGQAYVVGVADSTNFPGTANGTIPGFPKTGPTNRYIPHPNCPNCGGNINGILPPYNPDFPPQFSDGVVVKLNKLGDALLYSSYLGGSGDEVVHGVVHSTRAGANGVYIGGLTTSENPGPGGGVPSYFPPPAGGEPPWPTTWYAFPTTADAFQPTHKSSRVTRCDGGPRTSEKDDYPCPPVPSIPNDDAFITRLNDNADELPAAPVGAGGGGPVPADFSIAASPASLRIPVGTTKTFDVTTSATGGFTGPVAITHSSSPAGLTVTPASGTSTSPGYAPVTFTAGSNTTGTYDVTITGKSGTKTKTATLAVTVVTPDFRVSATPSTLSFPQVGGSAKFKVAIDSLDGFNKTVDLTHAVTLADGTTPSSGLTVTPNSVMVTPTGTTYAAQEFTVTASTPGSYKINLKGTGAGGQVHTATVSVTARPPNFSLTATPTSLTIARDGGTGTFDIKVNPIDGFTGTVALTRSYTPAGLTVTPASATSASPGYPKQTYTVTSSTPGTYTVTVVGKSGSLVKSAKVTVTVPSRTEFTGPRANSAANTSGDGNGFEVSPANAYSDDTLFAADNNSGGSTGTACTSANKDSHQFWNYGLTTTPATGPPVPAGATITGIEVRLDAWADSTAGTPKMCVGLSWNGGSFTTAKATPVLTTSQATYLLGGAGDGWGRTWTPANVSDANFRVRVIDVSGSLTSDFFLDWVSVRVHYR